MDPIAIASAVSDYGFPIVSSGLLLYLVYFIWKFITDKIEPLIEDIHGTTIALIDKVRMLDNDLIRLNQKVNTVLHLRGKTIEHERVMAEKEINRAAEEQESSGKK